MLGWGKGDGGGERGTYEGWDYAVGVGRWSAVPVLGDLLLAGEPNVSIVRAADGEEGLENISVEISLNIVRGMLRRLGFRIGE